MRFWMRPGRRRSREAARVGVAALALAHALPAAGAERATLLEAVQQIQRECLRAYPEELLREMASGAGEVPQAVEADPSEQMEFLDREAVREKGLFYPILLEDLLPAFERYLDPGARFLDLGSGDGRVVFLARLLGAEAIGIEYEPALVELSRRALAAVEDVIGAGGVEIVQGDFFASSWSGYDVVFYFDQSSFAQDRVRQKLSRELDPGAVLLVGHEQAPFPGLTWETAFPEAGAAHPDVTVYRRRRAPRGEPPKE